ncbi:unnamed protein product [Heligmosomoides polygyrus]|uniref:Reverse transcriptase domain-containing protein n=1 Tax=Heligmosomoides polygyrus TaxID=6339 RepID=A0A183FG49_HELPZ|nr:unnamed protein product [Heligmosomoides polygyrus]
MDKRVIRGIYLYEFKLGTTAKEADEKINAAFGQGCSTIRTAYQLIEWVRILYSCPKNRVQAAAGTSLEFHISVEKAATWALLYADDVMLASDDKNELERQVQALCDRLAMFALKLNVKKTEYVTTVVNESGSIKIDGPELPRTSVFKYLGSAIESDGKLMVEVNSHVTAASFKWRSLTGVLCDKKLPERFKSKICRAVVRPVMYGAECWPATKEVETRLSVMETKMLRWTAGVTRMGRIRNDAIRQKFGVAPIADKMREARLRWYGDVLRGKEDSVRNIGLNFELMAEIEDRYLSDIILRNNGNMLGRLTNEIHERRAEVLAEAGDAGLSIRNAWRNIANFKTKMTALRRPDETVTSSRRTMEKVIHDFYSDLFVSHVHLPPCHLPQDGCVVPSVLPSEIRYPISSVKKRTAPGPDRIRPEHLKNLSPVLINTWPWFFTRYLSECKVPSHKGGQ